MGRWATYQRRGSVGAPIAPVPVEQVTRQGASSAVWAVNTDISVSPTDWLSCKVNGMTPIYLGFGGNPGDAAWVLFYPGPVLSGHIWSVLTEPPGLLFEGNRHLRVPGAGTVV